MFKKLRKLISKKKKIPEAQLKKHLKYKEFAHKWDNQLLQELLTPHLEKIENYLSETYPNYEKFLFQFSSNAVDNINKKYYEIVSISEDTFASILSNYLRRQQELEQEKSDFEKTSKIKNVNKVNKFINEREKEKDKLEKELDNKSKEIIEESTKIFEKAFEKEFENFKTTVQDKLQDKISSKIKDVKNRFKKWKDNLQLILNDTRNEQVKKHKEALTKASKVLKKAAKDFGKYNYVISKDDKQLIMAIIYSGNENNKRFKLDKNNKLNDSDKDLFNIQDDKSLKFVINMMNFVVDDANKESRHNFIEKWFDKGCPLKHKDIT